ncbi:MAG: hypothetical protein BWY63_02401 [Chloroflexi bacterium ADurb.Bin360]|nr:MAG: hypothetical protein BWY63_02401 [Chloroflexi bacterium ADurb.Bin360]
MGDKDRGFTFSSHNPQHAFQFLRLLRCQHSCRLVQNKNFCTAIDQFENLHTLLFTHTQLPDIGIWVYLQVIALRELTNTLAYLADIWHKRQIAQAKDDVLSNSHGLDEHEILMHHANP